LALSDVLVLPSYSEPWGLVVNEAMACGMPVIVSEKCGCAPDLVQNGKNGISINPLMVKV
jgi:glycosyltransferase involved in cell wall biosynthesis